MGKADNDAGNVKGKTSKLAVGSFSLSILSVASIYATLSFWRSEPCIRDFGGLVASVSAGSAILLGIISIIKINMSKGKVTGTWLAIGGIAIAVIFMELTVRAIGAR